MIEAAPVLGIDPSMDRTGLAIIAGDKLVSYTTVPGNPFKHLPDPERFTAIADSVRGFVSCYPEVERAVIEMPFNKKNVKTFGRLSRLGGCIEGGLVEMGIKIVQVTPKEAKKAVGGGAFSKQQVVYIVQSEFGLPKDMSKTDSEAVADAVAIALAGRGKT